MLDAGGCLARLARGYRQLGWAAVVLGVALFIPYADFVALLATGLWIVVVSILLARTGAEHRYMPAPGTA